MVKKAQGELTIAEATRQIWGELGKNALGTDVATLVNTRHGFDVPSSTVSNAKKHVFGVKAMKSRGKSKTAPVRARAGAAAGQASTQTKTAVVAELLKSGLRGPKEISEAAKKLGHDISKNYVSGIKANLKKKRSAARRQRTTVSSTVTPVATPVAAARMTPAKTNLEVENAALRFALSAGSVEAAIEALRRLQ